MLVDIIMPKMGESITEGTIIEWRKNVGDSLEKDEIFLEIGTDKVDSEIPSIAEGILEKKIYKENDVVKVGEIIAIIETGSNIDLAENNEKKTIENNDFQEEKMD